MSDGFHPLLFCLWLACVAGENNVYECASAADGGDFGPAACGSATNGTGSVHACITPFCRMF